MNKTTAWLLAIRPKTLTLAASPVLAGSALAWAQQNSLNWPVFLNCLLAAMAIQVGTNLYNDAADHERGADGPERLGPSRATAQGWLRAAEVKQGAAVAFSFALLLGIYLAGVGGWPILLLGLFSIACGYAYTGGPLPIAYSPSGELFVFLFFGLTATAGSHYLQTLGFNTDALALGAALGCMAAAVLLINNYRDLDTDRRAGKLTLSHRLQRSGSRRLYVLLLLAPHLLPLWLPQGWPIWLSLPLAIWLIRRLHRLPIGPGLNGLLAATAGLQLVYTLLFCIGLLI